MTLKHDSVSVSLNHEGKMNKDNLKHEKIEKCNNDELP